MDIFEKDKIQRIQDYIVELYDLKLQDGELNAEGRKMLNDKAFNNWMSALRGYSEVQIKEAINWYHKNKNNRTAPRISQILSALERKVYENSDSFVVDNPKPICPIEDWQKDFDTVLREACILRIVHNPYWSNQPEVKDNFPGTYLRKPNGDLSTKTYAIYWKECLKKARDENISEFEAISRFDDLMLDYTLAYRLGRLKF